MAQTYQAGTEAPKAGGEARGRVPVRGGALDLLRFLAALLIVVYHYGQNAPVALDALHPVFARGYLATDFFLILSGYVLGRAYGRQVMYRQITPAAFLGKRLTRLWPAQLIVLVAMAVIVGAALLVGVRPEHPENYSPLAWLMQLGFVQAWGLPGGGGWNHQSWSLSALVVCYAAFPLAWRWVSRLRSSSALLSLGLLAVMLGDLLCVTTLGRHIYDLEFHFGVIRALPMFMLGLCIARVVDEGRTPLAAAHAMGWLAAGVLVFLQIAGRFDLPSIVAIAAIILACGRVPVKRPSALIEEGAKLSFALFITHALTGLVWFGLVQQIEARFELPLSVHWLLWAGAIPAALLVSAAFHRWVDEPVQVWLNRALARRRSDPAPV
ncbi:MAG: acyltransferase family protein [Caulobacter sp.]